MLAFLWPFSYLALLVFILYFLLRPIIRGAVYFPTKPRSVDIMIELSGVRPGQKIADIGSGDGRILIAFAEKGIEAHGYEINPLLVWRSRQAIRRARLENRAFVHWKDFWRVNFSGFDAIIVYGMTHIMDGLENKLGKEVRPGTAVVSNIYQFPHWKPVAQKEKIYLYRVGTDGKE